jgi:hypothetical protein
MRNSPPHNALKSLKSAKESQFLGSRGQKLLSNRLKLPEVTSTDGSRASATSSLAVRGIGPTLPRLIWTEEDPARPPACEGPRSEAATAAPCPSGNRRAGEIAGAGCRRSSNPQPGETAESGRRRSGCDGVAMSLRLDSRSALGARPKSRATADASGKPRAGKMAEAGCRRSGCDGVETSLRLDSGATLGAGFRWRATAKADASDDPLAAGTADAGCRRSNNPQAGCGRSFCDGLEMSLRRDSRSDLGERFKWRATAADTSDDPWAGDMAEAGCRGTAGDGLEASLRVDSRSAFGARYT